MVPLLSVFMLLASGAPSSPSPPPVVRWFDAAEFEIEGRGWADAAGPFVRLPAHAEPVVPASVWHLSHHSAGLCVRFATDAPSISVRWTLTSSDLDMPQMPSTGVSGVDLYVLDGRHGWRFMGNGRPTGQRSEAELPTDARAGAKRECALYLPLYNGVGSVRIGVPEGCVISRGAPRPPGLRRPVVVYGTSIVQGGCASRPGMAWATILGRMLDRPIVNLGFAGSGLMEPEVSALLAELDPAVYVIDCLWNMALLTEAEILRRVEILITTLRAAHAGTPIVFVGQSYIHPRAHPTNWSAYQAAAVRKAIRAGVQGLVLVDGARLIGADGEGTADGCHPSDLGMMRQATALRPVLLRLLKERGAAEPR